MIRKAVSWLKTGMGDTAGMPKTKAMSETREFAALSFSVLQGRFATDFNL
jgi:hypothetical protein